MNHWFYQRPRTSGTIRKKVTSLDFIPENVQEQLTSKRSLESSKDLVHAVSLPSAASVGAIL